MYASRPGVSRLPRPITDIRARFATFDTQVADVRALSLYRGNQYNCGVQIPDRSESGGTQRRVLCKNSRSLHGE